MAKALDVTMSACLEALDRGESVDSILSRYPAMATELRPFLETAVSLKTQPVNPTIAAKAASLTAMKKEAAILRPQKSGFLSQFFQQARRFSPAMAVFALLIVLFMATIAPPNSPLYGARLFLDDLRGDQQENDAVVDVPVRETAVSPIISATMTISVTAVLQMTDTPLPTATPSPTLTVSITPTATVTRTATPNSTPSPTLMPPIETATPQPPAPIATAVDDDDDDDEPDEPDESDESDESDDESDDDDDDESDESDDPEPDDD